jgi:hypothetical protein
MRVDARDLARDLTKYWSRSTTRDLCTISNED